MLTVKGIGEFSAALEKAGADMLVGEVAREGEGDVYVFSAGDYELALECYTSYENEEVDVTVRKKK